MSNNETSGSRERRDDTVTSMMLGIIRSQGITDPARQREIVAEELDFCWAARGRYSSEPETMARVDAIEQQLYAALDTLDAGGALTFPAPEQA